MNREKKGCGAGVVYWFGGNLDCYVKLASAKLDPMDDVGGNCFLDVSPASASI
jgi:hypothetical protein